jgi:hypothetical protein
MVYKESSLCSQDSAFGCVSTESLPACLINFLPESFGALSLHLSHPTFLGVRLKFRGLCFHLIVTSSVSRPSKRAAPAMHHWMCWSKGRDPLYSEPRRQVCSHKRTQKGSGTNLGAPLIRLVRTWVRIYACFRRQNRSLINSQQRHPSNPLLRWNNISPDQGVGWKYCTVWECLKVQARHTAQLQSKCGVLICRSMMTSYGLVWALTGAPVSYTDSLQLRDV